MQQTFEALQRLRGANILIGKDEQTSRLLIVANFQGKQIKFGLGNPGTVPNCVSRCRPHENVGHCMLTILPDGNMMISNLKAQNVTYVNGMPVAQCGIDQNCNVQLGHELFNLNIREVLTTARQAVDKAIPPEYDITHLENVWEHYRKEVAEIKKKQKNLSLLSRLSMPFTLASGLIASMLQFMGNTSGNATVFLWPLTGIGFIIMITSLVLSARDKSPEMLESAAERLQDTYVCPNPSCRHFMGMQPYKVLRQTKQCPYCRGKFKTSIPVSGAYPPSFNQGW